MGVKKEQTIEWAWENVDSVSATSDMTAMLLIVRHIKLIF
jgi:hypothetical protein